MNKKCLQFIVYIKHIKIQEYKATKMQRNNTLKKRNIQMMNNKYLLVLFLGLLAGMCGLVCLALLLSVLELFLPVGDQLVVVVVGLSGLNPSGLLGGLKKSHLIIQFYPK